MQPISNGRKKKMNKETHKFTWQGIEIEVRYNPQWHALYAHLEIRSINPKCAPLPMTETGYKSQFHPQGTIEAHEGGVIGKLLLGWMRRRRSLNGKLI